MAALFACTKCHRRFPFDDLSHGDQLCKECRSNYPVVKCTYCRAEFQLNSKGSTTTICAKCAQNVKHYGKPSACEYCSIQAAFIGKRCQRCVNSEKKWGPPLGCEQCKLKCAFDRSEEGRKKVDGKVLCWLCTQAYKRVLAKTRKSQDFAVGLKHSTSSLRESQSGESLESRISLLTSQPESLDTRSGLAAVIMQLATSNTKFNTSSTGGGSSENQATGVGDIGASNGHQHRIKHGKTRSLSEKTSSLLDRTTNLTDKGDVPALGAGGAGGGSENMEWREDGQRHSQHKSKSHHHHHHHHRHHSKHHHHHHHHDENKEENDEPGVKKPKMEKSVSNGITVSTPKSTGSSVSDPGIMDTGTSDNVILITQLREQIESLKKQISAKDAQLLEKDKKITELKAEHYEAEKEARLKVLNLQKQHEEEVNNLQIKNRELQRQVTKLSKGVKKSVLESVSGSS